MRAPGQRQRRLAAPDGVEALGVAGGRHVGPRPLLDELLPRSGVRLREQALGGDLHEVRIAVIGVTVGERQLDRLDDPVQVGRRVVAERLQIDPVQQIQHLQQRRALAPEATRGDFVSVVRRAQGRADLDAELCEIGGRQGPALRSVELGDALRRLAAVELVAGRAHAGLAAAACLRLGAHHPPKRLAQLPLHEDFTRAVRAAVAQVERGRRRPALVLVGVRPHLVRAERRHREAPLGVLGGGERDVGERHRAPSLERRAPRVGRRRHDGPRQPGRNLAGVPLAEQRRGRRARVRADAGDLPRLTGARDVDQDRRHARDAHHVAVDDPERHPARDAGVDRVAARGQDARRGRGGERVARGHRPACADHLRGGRRCVARRLLLGTDGV